MKIKNKIIIQLILILLASVSINAQIKYVNVFADYSQPMDKRLSVNKISGMGGGAEINFNIYSGISISFTAGYRLYSLQQDSAIAKWNWKFWLTRYKNIVATDLNADPTLKATLDPVQKMDVIPAMLSVKYSRAIISKFTAQIGLSAGVFFYTRRLYLNEHWSKRFSSIDYTFDYAYRNFADNKYGNPFFYNGSLDLGYEFTDNICLNFGASYLQVVEKEHTGYESFPFKNSFDIKLGLTFLY